MASKKAIAAKRKQIRDTLLESVSNTPLMGSLTSKKEDKDGMLAAKRVVKTQADQVQLVQKQNAILTRISGNVFVIADQLGAELVSLQNLGQILKEQSRQDFIDKQSAAAKAEEASLEAKQAVPVRADGKENPAEYKKTLGDFLKGSLDVGKIVKTVLGGGLSFLKKAGSFLIRGLALFTNPIGLAAVVIGTIGTGIYKYFTDSDFKQNVDGLFDKVKEVVVEKFGQAKDLFSEYIVNPIVNFLSTVKDRLLGWMIGLLENLKAVPYIGDKVKSVISGLEAMKTPVSSPAADPKYANAPNESSAETARLARSGSQATPVASAASTPVAQAVPDDVSSDKELQTYFEKPENAGDNLKLKDIQNRINVINNNIATTKQLINSESDPNTAKMYQDTLKNQLEPELSVAVKQKKDIVDNARSVINSKKKSTVSATPVAPEPESKGVQSAATGGGSAPSASGAMSQAAPEKNVPSSGSDVTMASSAVERAQTAPKSPIISNVDNSSSSMSSTEQGTRFKIPSPVANRGSIDKMSFSFT